MNRPQRPLSPHLIDYRWQLHMMMSIVHRMTGVFLSAGFIYITGWLIAIAAGPEAYRTFLAISGTWLGQLILFGFSLALIYHLLNGIRHMFWDIGRGFEIATIRRSGIFVILLTVVLTIAAWVAGYMIAGRL